MKIVIKCFFFYTFCNNQQWEGFPAGTLRITEFQHTSWSGHHLAPAWPLTCCVLITRPYHRPGAQLNLTAGSTTDLRGYEPNEPAHWWDGFRQAIPEFPWEVLPWSHSSPHLAARPPLSMHFLSYTLLASVTTWTSENGDHTGCRLTVAIATISLTTSPNGSVSQYFCNIFTIN